MPIKLLDTSGIWNMYYDKFEKYQDKTIGIIDDTQIDPGRRLIVGNLKYFNFKLKTDGSDYESKLQLSLHGSKTEGFSKRILRYSFGNDKFSYHPRFIFEPIFPVDESGYVDIYITSDPDCFARMVRKKAEGIDASEDFKRMLEESRSMLRLNRR